MGKVSTRDAAMLSYGGACSESSKSQRSRLMSVRRRPATVIVALVLYTGAAFLFTIQAWVDPTRAWPGQPTDSFKFMGFLAWIPHALSMGENPLFMSSIDYPRGVNLAWETPVPLGSILTWPINATFGPVAAYDVWVVLALATNGWCSFLWLRRHVDHDFAAFVGGIFCAFGPFAAAHSQGHANLIAFAAIPLLLIVLEKTFDARTPTWRLGVAAGLLAGAQLYVSEELLAIAAITVGVTVVVVVVTHRQMVGPRLRYVTSVVAWAAGVFLVVGAPMLLYQFFGPYPIRGPIQPFGVYVTDLANLVIPTGVTWLPPADVTAPLTASWTGNMYEQTAYLGLPVIAVSLFATVRWWRLPAVRVIALTTVIIQILSFGPHLHVDGADTRIPLPGAAFSYIPVLNNLLPGRLSLIVELGVAAILAITIDRSLLRLSLKTLAVTTVSLVSIAVALPHPILASTASVPDYFTSSSGARQLPAGSVALVGPYIDDGGATAVPMLWQAEANFRFALIDGFAITVDSRGHVTWLLDSPIREAFHSIQAEGVTPPETENARRALLALLDRDGVTIIIVGPMNHRDLAISFLTWLTRLPPRETQGVFLWQLAGR